MHDARFEGISMAYRLAVARFGRSRRRSQRHMPTPPARATQPNAVSRHALLAGVSALTLMLAMPQMAVARSLGTGGSQLSATSVTSAAAIAAAQQAADAAARGQASMLRATQAIQAMQAAQANAQALARNAPNAVPNGLAPGGLMPVANPVPAAQDTTGLQTWEGAQLPTQSSNANGGVDVTVRQTQSNAILSWQSFNVGSKTTLTFDQQGNASWIALNRVVGSTAPSQILGSIKADGTVLVINQSGIIFGGGAQINVNSLIASTLDVGRAIDSTTNTIRTLAQRNQEFLADGLLGYADINGTNVGSTIPNSTFSPSSNLVTKTGTNTFSYQSAGSILVQNGAQIEPAL
jgi:filamentous hemagglutinin family protein